MPKPEIVVAGGICVDVLPTFIGAQKSAAEVLAPGKMTYTGPMLAATGGAVSNTGQALHRLGVSVRLMGKVGNDLWGDATVQIVSALDSELARGLIRTDEPGSYTVVLSSPGFDRLFLHFPGPNDTFCAEDVELEVVAAARYFHFGYPSIMRRVYEDGGEEMARILASVRQLGVTTSLDMTYPDPASDAGKVDWRAWLTKVLPHVDIFMPSLEELLFMLAPEREALLWGHDDEPAIIDCALLHDLSNQILAMESAMALIKLGERGVYLRTTTDALRLKAAGKGMPANFEAWRGRELHAPSFRVWVQGTTGAGDCAIAGFLSALSKDLSPEDSLIAASAVGACSVEQTDATSGVPHWDAVQARIAAGWETLPARIALQGWTRGDSLVSIAPDDGRGRSAQ